jgi:hypothetical protein
MSELLSDQPFGIYLLPAVLVVLLLLFLLVYRRRRVRARSFVGVLEAIAFERSRYLIIPNAD